MSEQRTSNFALNNFQKSIDSMLNNLTTDISRMSIKDIKRLVSRFRIRLIELEIENEKLQRTQFDLSDSLDHYAQLFDYAPVGYFVLNGNGVVIESNLTFTRMLGVVRMELIGRLIVEYIHPNDLNLFENFIQGFSRNLFKKNVRIRINNTFGEYSLIELQGNVSHNNEAGIEICIAVIEAQEQEPEKITSSFEVLNRKLDDQIAQSCVANRELQKNIKDLAISKKIIVEREARLNSIFNAATEGIITVDDCGIIVSVNKSIQSIFGYSESELIGKKASFLLCNNNHLQSRILFGEYVLDDKSAASKIGEIEGKHKDGLLIPIDISVAKFKIGKKSFCTGILRDVRERKRKEQKDKEHLDELAHVTRLGLMGEMASGIAHEVNQPLTALSSYLKACLMISASKDPADQDILIKTVQKASNQALMAGKIIHRMRDFVKSRKMEKALVDINYLVDEAMSLCENEFKQYGILCKKELDMVLPSVKVDKIHIEQVLLNLMKNSAEALSTLPDDIQRILIVQTYLDSKDQIEVRIKDNGPGMDKNERLKILKPFFTTKKSGMGMGLSISRSIIEAHHGFLRFNSKKGKGSTFYFTLPLSA